MKTKPLYLTFLLALATAGSVVSQEHGDSNARKCNDCFPEGGGGGGEGGSTTFPACTALSNGAVLYVDQSKAASGNGTSWAQAVKSLSEALQYANDCDKVSEIRVARGTYKPSTTANAASRKHAFFIERGYKLTGGYPSGGGTYDPAANPTILDGDLGSGFRSFHVLIVNSLLQPVTIEGFRVRNGAADGSGTLDLGTYLLTEGGGGAAAIVESANVVFRNCAFYNNGTAETVKGGAFYGYSSSITLLNCVVAQNTTDNGGGGVTIDGLTSYFRAINSTFYGNTGEYGAIYCHLTSLARLSNCIVWGNSSAWGGNGTRQAEYSIIQGGSTGTGNQDADPQFRNPSDPNGADNQWFTDDDGLSLLSCSPAINRGSNAAVSGFSLTTDITGEDRIHNVTIDAGPYEYQFIPQPGAASSLVGLEHAGYPDVTSYVYGGPTIIHLDCKVMAAITPQGAAPVSGAVIAHVYNYGGGNLPQYEGTEYVRRHYHLHPVNNANAATAKVTLYFTQDEFDTYNAEVGTRRPNLPKNSADTEGNKSNLLVTQFHGNPSGHLGRLPQSYTEGHVVFHPKNEDIVWHAGRGGTPGNPAQGYWSVTFPVTGFSGFFVSAGTNDPLPVTLVSFGAQPENNTVQLSWKTTAESNSSHFLVQRSTEGREFTEIGRVEAAGNSEGTRSYGFTDDTAPAQPAPSLLYYRLKQVDRDGTNIFSRVVTAQMQARQDMEGVVLLGNPVSDGLRFRYRAAGHEKVRIRLRDVTGKLLDSVSRQLSPGEHELSLAMQKLPAGLYLAEVQASGERKVFRIVKE